MNGKVLTILVILIACASMITLGCTGKNTSIPTPVPTQNPTATQGSTASQGNVSITPTPSAGTNSSSVNASTLDDSLVSISGESDESLPEDNIPTPDASQ